MSDIIYLYLKTHNVTGLKYLGKTTQDPFKYNGSGKYWKLHLKEHGINLTTKILYQTNDNEEFKKVATYYSHKYNIVESNKFANLIIEEGQGGDTWSGKHHSEESKLKISKSKRGIKTGVLPHHKLPKSKSFKKRVSESMKKHVSKNGNNATGKRWWNDGLTNVFKKECPGDRYVLGRILSNKNHPLKKAIQTPYGEYESLKSAANALNITTYYIKKFINDSSYLDWSYK